MTARTRQAALCMEAADADARLSAFIAATGEYADNPAYRDRIDRERAARQAAVYARMDAAIARYRSRSA